MTRKAGRDLEIGQESAGKEVAECVICMSEVDLDNLRSRMITPCNHAFHTECLQKWMEVKLECPTCTYITEKIKITQYIKISL